eukprot:s5495_g11.t1
MLFPSEAEEGALEEAIRSDLVTLDGRLEHLSADVGTYLAATEATSSDKCLHHWASDFSHIGVQLYQWAQEGMPGVLGGARCWNCPGMFSAEAAR